MLFSDANDAFNHAFKGRLNVLTPEIIRRGRKGAFFYELSQSRDRLDPFMKEAVGVTIVNTYGVRIQDLSILCDNLEEAEKYVENLPAIAAMTPDAS